LRCPFSDATQFSLDRDIQVSDPAIIVLVDGPIRFLVLKVLAAPVKNAVGLAAFGKVKPEINQTIGERREEAGSQFQP